MSEWKIIVQDQDLDNRVGEHNSPTVINTDEYEFDDKESAFKKFAQLFNEYQEKADDYKGHSFGALKFYYEKDGKDILTYVLLYQNGKEYEHATTEEVKLLYGYIALSM